MASVAPEATSKRKGKAKAIAKAPQVLQVEPRAKKPRGPKGPPVKYADADGDYSDSSSS